MYYQTTSLTEQQVTDGHRIAANQDEVILRLMILRGGDWTAWEIFEALAPEYDYLITSIRRSLFTLEKEGKIMWKVDVQGPRGKPVGKYSVIYFQGKLF